VLPRPDPTTRALIGRVGQACRDAVLRSPERPCAGLTFGGRFRVEDFVGSVKLLAWAKDNGCPWEAHTCAAVAKGGRLEVLQWAREHDCPWDGSMCEAAFHGGRLQVLRWAREHGCPWDSNVLCAWRQGCPALRQLWDLSQPVTAWEGVTFGMAGGAGVGRVVKINLHFKGLTGDLPAALGELTALTMLELYGNQLTSVPAALGGLTALTMSNLFGNQLTSVPAELGALTALKTLSLLDNQLECVPAALGGLTALESLCLNLNRLTSVPAELGGLTALKWLYLNGNQLTSVPAEWEEEGALEQSGCSIFR
jgi:hypothetical protein